MTARSGRPIRAADHVSGVASGPANLRVAADHLDAWADRAGLDDADRAAAADVALRMRRRAVWVARQARELDAEPVPDTEDEW